MGHVGLVMAFVCQDLPVFAICRLPQYILVIDTGIFPRKLESTS